MLNVEHGGILMPLDSKSRKAKDSIPDTIAADLEGGSSSSSYADERIFTADAIPTDSSKTARTPSKKDELPDTIKRDQQ